MLKFYKDEAGYYFFYETYFKRKVFVEELYVGSTLVYKLLYKKVLYYFYDHPNFYR